LGARRQEDGTMTETQVQDLFRKAIAGNDADAMSEGLQLLLGLDASGGLSAEREYLLRRPDFVMEMPQSGERIRGRDAMRELQRRFPGGVGPSVALRRVVGGARVWVIESSADYGEDHWQVVVIFEFDDEGLIAKETRYYTRAFEAPEWRADLVETMDDGEGSATS
jgi:hypothetical protein